MKHPKKAIAKAVEVNNCTMTEAIFSNLDSGSEGGWLIVGYVGSDPEDGWQLTGRNADEVLSKIRQRKIDDWD